MSDLLKKTDEELIQLIVDQDYKDSERVIKPRHQKYMDWYKLYNGMIDDKNKRPNGANLFIRYTQAMVDTMISRCMQTLFGQRPYCNIIGREKSDEANAKTMNSLIDYQLDTKINIVEKFYNILMEVFLYGTSHVYLDWKKQTKQIKTKQDKNFLGIKIGIEELLQNITVYDAPDIIHIDTFNNYRDPNATDFEDARFNIVKSFLTLPELKDREKQGIYKNIDQVEENYNTDIEEIDELRRQALGLGDKDKTKSKRNEILTYYTDEAIIAVCNRKHIIRKVENPNYCQEKMFAKIVAKPMPHEWEGKGLVEALESLQLELNATRNQRIDNVSLIINKMWFYNPNNSDLDPSTLVSKPGGLIPRVNPDDLVPIEFTDVTGSAYNEEQIIKQDMQYISSVSDYAKGVTTTASVDETATAVKNKQEASSINFNTIIQMVYITGIMPIYDKMIKLNQQYMQREEVIRIVGEDGLEYPSVITPQDIVGNFDLKQANPNFELPLGKDAKRSQFIELFNIVSSNSAALQNINMVGLLKKMMDLFDVKDYETLLIQQPTLPPNSIPGSSPNPMEPVPNEQAQIIPSDSQVLEGMGGGMNGY